MYCYRYPHPALTTDVALFSVREQCLQLLLVKRGQDPFEGCWALPGGFVDIDEDLEDCARRELAEETGISGIYLEQLGTFGRPDRDPRERVVSVVYVGSVPDGGIEPRAGSDAADAAWFPVNALPELAFDHADIINQGHQRLLGKLHYSTIAFTLIPEIFTLAEVQALYETLLEEPLDKRNFRKWLMSLNRIEDTGRTRRNGKHRPARLYRLRSGDRQRVEIIR